MHKIIEKLDVKIPQRDLLLKDWRYRLQALFTNWIPLNKTVLDAIVRILPSPLKAQPIRIPAIWTNLNLGVSLNEGMESNVENIPILRKDSSEEVVPGNFVPQRSSIEKNGLCTVLSRAILSCDNKSDAPVFVYVAKMFSVPKGSVLKKSSVTIVRKAYIRGLFRSNPDTKPDEEDSFPTPEDPAPLAPVPVEEKSGSVVEEAGQPDALITEELKIKEVKADVLRDEDDEKEEIFIGMARIFSGVLTTSSKIYVFGPKYDPSKHDLDDHTLYSSQSADKFEFSSSQEAEKKGKNSSSQYVCCLQPHDFQLFMLMGRDLEPIQSISAGNVFGIGGLGKFITTTATISTLPKVIPMNKMQFQSVPIVRVAVEPTNIMNLKVLTAGLRLLYQADGNIEVTVQETGEHVIIVSGELHLEKCLRDLQDRYAKGIELKVSEPIVPLREGLLSDLKNHESVVVSPPGKVVTFTVRAHPLPMNVFTFLNLHAEFLKSFRNLEDATLDLKNGVKEFLENLQKEFRNAGGRWKHVEIRQLWAFGPRFSGTNLLFLSPVCKYRDFLTTSVNAHLHSVDELIEEKLEADVELFRQFETSIVSGFQLATSAGTLMEEPLMGVAFEIEQIEISLVVEQNLKNFSYGPISGQVISCVKDACRKAFAAASPRVIEPIYKVELQATAEVLGRLYGVIGKRRGQILDEKLREGTNIFNVVAYLPVVESFGFTDELRKRTSGVAFPQLLFSHWQIIAQDPFFVPTTEEELEEFGAIDYSANLARVLVDKTRRRKGLFVEEKLVESATKQRTLSKKA